MRPLSEHDHYEILEIPRDASAQAVERAYRLARSTFADDSLALYSVVSPHDAEAIRLRVEEAHRVLSDPQARTAYDAALPDASVEPPEIRFDAEPARPEPLAPSGEVLAPSGEALGPCATAADGTPGRYDGAAFRAARIRHALDLEQIASITKVNPRYLRYIEEENVDGLPARVYVRGFVEAYARVVGLDPGQAVAGYLQIIEQGAPPPPRRRSRFLGRT